MHAFCAFSFSRPVDSNRYCWLLRKTGQQGKVEDLEQIGLRPTCTCVKFRPLRQFCSCIGSHTERKYTANCGEVGWRPCNEASNSVQPLKPGRKDQEPITGLILTEKIKVTLGFYNNTDIATECNLVQCSGITIAPSQCSVYFFTRNVIIPALCKQRCLQLRCQRKLHITQDTYVSVCAPTPSP